MNGLEFEQIRHDVTTLRERGSTERWWQESNTKRNSTISRTIAVQKQVRVPHFQRPQGREGELERETRTPVGQASEGGIWAPSTPPSSIG